MGCVVGVVGADLAVAGGDRDVDDDDDLRLVVVAADVTCCCSWY
jgi:hypothetical protein